MDEVQDVNGGGLLGAIVAVLLTPVSVPVAVGVSIAAAVVNRPGFCGGSFV
jgi:hypothetical protein